MSRLFGEMRQIGIVVRDIEAGEELTARYGATHHAGQLVCRCGAPNCRGAL